MKRVGKLQTSDMYGGFVTWNKQVGQLCHPHDRIVDIETQKYVIGVYGHHLGLKRDMVLKRQCIKGSFTCQRGDTIRVAVFAKQ